jgi:hypothetical protein
MYWPVGAPRIYAASRSSNNASSNDAVVESDDDAESRETTEGSGSLLNAPSIDSGRGLEDDEVTPGIKPVEHDNQRRSSVGLIGQDTPLAGVGSLPVDKEPLLALRLSRIGHLFAVITATSLTIWQTKVWPTEGRYEHRC